LWRAIDPNYPDETYATLMGKPGIPANPRSLAGPSRLLANGLSFARFLAACGLSLALNFR
jgi:hypothetical protein